MKKAEGKLKNALVNIFVCLVATFAVTLLGFRLFGFQLYTIMSGSMEPNFKTGSLVYVRPVSAETLRVGDVITYLVSDKTIVTHRIIEVLEETDSSGKIVRRFKTQGDANSNADPKLVKEENILGRSYFSIPFLGYLAFYLSRPPLLYLAFIVLGFLVYSAFRPNAEVKKRKEKTIYQEFT